MLCNRLPSTWPLLGMGPTLLVTGEGRGGGGRGLMGIPLFFLAPPFLWWESSFGGAYFGGKLILVVSLFWWDN